ncbi:MAG: ankyrin repeat domain-containing protein [Anaerolineae bacterium]|nr:ankyrin repeat domain-containing protein [Anaerolineae bacterium]
MALGQEIIDEFVGVAHGDFARVQALLAAHPALLNARTSWDESAIEAAAQVGRRDIIQFLLEHGAPLDICTAAVLGMADRVNTFLQTDPSLINAQGAHGIPLLYFPVIGGHQVIAETLLQRGANINAGEGGSPSIHGAVMFRQADMLKWLLDHGANVNALNYDNKTPLAVAQANGADEIAAILRQYDGREA